MAPVRSIGVACALSAVALGACGGGHQASHSAAATQSSSRPSPTPRPAPAVDPGTLPQTPALPSASTAGFRARMGALWRGVATGSADTAMAAFFPRSAYLQVKAVADPGADYANRLVAAFRADIRAAHALLGSSARNATLIAVTVPHEWSWIPPGSCANKVGYWHAPGSRLVYRAGGGVRSFGVFSLISWRGEWYVVHLSSYTQPGTVDSPAAGSGAYGPPGGC